MIATNAEQSWIELKETYMGDLCTYCLWKHALKLTCPAKAWSMLPVIPVLAVSHDCYEFNMWLVSLRSNFSSQTALQCYIDILTHTTLKPEDERPWNYFMSNHNLLLPSRLAYRWSWCLIHRLSPAVVRSTSDTICSLRALISFSRTLSSSIRASFPRATNGDHSGSPLPGCIHISGWRGIQPGSVRAYQVCWFYR